MKNPFILFLIFLFNPYFCTRILEFVLMQHPISEVNIIYRKFLRFLFSLSFLFTVSFVFAGDPDLHAQEPGSPAKEEAKFDAGTMITEHITDSHEWHLWGDEKHPVSIPLPVIIFEKGKGLSVFMSSAFRHGEDDHNGYRLLTHENMEKHHIEGHSREEIVAVDADGNIDEARTANIFDISITKNVFSVIFTGLLMLWIFTAVAKAYTRRPGMAPKGLQSLMEPLIIFIRDDVARPAIGEKKYRKFMPFLLTVFFFIWITNLLGLIPIFPGGANVTGNIAVTGSLAILTFLITTFNGNGHYWRHIFAMPGVPPWVLIILTPIEILGVFLRPFVLMIRLFANMSAGHIIALSFFSLIFIFGEMNAGAGWGVSVVSVAFTVFMFVLELLVAFLQAYVFTLLSAIYFGGAVEEHHEHDDHAHDHHYAVPEQEQQAII